MNINHTALTNQTTPSISGYCIPGSFVIDKKPETTVYYLAGPMSGLPNYNYPAFNEIAFKIRAAGFEVRNPAEIDNGVSTNGDYNYYFTKAIQLLLESDALVMLPNWKNSKGASMEYMLGRFLKKPIYDVEFNIILEDEISTGRETICQEADRIVTDDRINDYGHPKDNFGLIGRLWAAILGIDAIKPETIGLLMIALKMAREVYTPTRDNLVDMAGYAKCIQMIYDKKN